MSNKRIKKKWKKFGFRSSWAKSGKVFINWIRLQNPYIPIISIYGDE